MQFAKLNRQDPEKVFIVCRNISGATISAGGAVYFDTASTTDGNAVSGARTGQKFLFAGILEAAAANSSYGRVQTYGVGSAYMVLNSSAVSATPGIQLDAVTSATYLKDFTASDYFLSGALSAANATMNAWNFVTLMDTYASAASANSTPALKKVFIRSM